MRGRPPRRTGIRHETGSGHRDDPTGSGRRRARIVDNRRCGVRPALRTAPGLGAARLPLRVAVPVNQRVIAKTGPLGRGFRADELIKSLSGRAWRTRSAGNGAKGERRYAWARARINGTNDGQAEHWLLSCRSLTDPPDMAYCICHAPARVSLAELVRVAGTRWATEETFQTAKGETGLDHYQVRHYTGW